MLVAAVICTVQVGFGPRHPPDQERNLHPFAGVAVKRSGTKEGNEAEHFGRQVMPALELRTAPRPETAVVSRKTSGAKTADTVAPGATSTVHVEDPRQAPAQRTSFAPGRGTGVSPSRVAVFQVVVQLCVQSRPGTSAVTPPGPDRGLSRRAEIGPGTDA